jgi:hypothetical protein
MKALLHITILFLLSTLSGCIGDPIKQALSELDDLKIILDKDLGDIKTEMEKWRTELPEEVRNLINDDIQKLSRDIVGATGAETKCTIDFLRARFKQSVENIKSKLLGRRIVYQQPCFCTLNLPMINPNSESKSIESIIFYGYDFNNRDSSNKLMKVVLVGDSSSREIDENYIGRNSNYQITINLIDILPEIASNKYHKLKIFWNGDSTSLSEAIISEWNPETKFDPFKPNALQFYPPHTGGNDTELDTKPGNWANGQVELQLRVNGNNIEGRVFYDVMEFGGDNTRFGIDGNGEARAWGQWTPIYTNVKPNYELIGFSPAAPTRYPFAVTDHNSPKHFYQGGSAVSQFEAFVDQEGDDRGYPHVNVLFNEMKAVLRQKPPIRWR